MSRRSRRRASPRRRRPAPRAQQEVDLRREYRYVLADLKRIGVLAAVMIAVLIGLSLLLP